MPTSAPGTCSHLHSHRGFTLLEVLVVMLVMGLLAGLASVIMRPDERGLLRLEAERLAQLLELAAVESRLTGRSVAWTAQGSGYRFWQVGMHGEWADVADSEPLRPRTLPQGMSILSLQVESAPARAGMRLEFAPYFHALAFEIEMSLGAARYAVSASPLGELRVAPR